MFNSHKEMFTHTDDIQKLISDLNKKRSEYDQLILSLKEKHREADRLLKDIRKCKRDIQKHI